MPIALTGFLLNTIIAFAEIEPTNRHDRRQKAKIGYVKKSSQWA